MKALLAVALALYLALWAVLTNDQIPERNFVLLLGATVVFAVLITLLTRLTSPPRQLALLVLAVGALLQLIALTHSPLTSDDAYRYLWDAKVQLHGIDPYRYAPDAPQLAYLRDGHLFGPSSSCAHPIPASCTAINRPTVHTIYPPVAEAAFVIGRLVSFGGHGTLFAFQVLGALGATAITVLLLRRALRRGDPVWPVALWAWCPVVVAEFGNNAHIDWLGVLFVVLALQARRNLSAAGWLGAAIATKLYPVLILPSLMRRRPWLVAGAALGLVIAVYIPHVIAVGSAVIGYLPGYLHEEGYNSGTRFLLLGRVFPHPVDTVVGVAVVAAVGLWAWRRSDPSAPEQTATILTGVAFLVATPAYGWYAPLLIALAVLSARYEWVILGLAPSFVYIVHSYVATWSGWSSISYALGGIGTAVVWWYRTRRGRAQKPLAVADCGIRP